MAQTIFHPAAGRGHANHGWLDTYFSFSFAEYYDPKKVHFGMLRVLNDDTVKGGYGFGKHPHDNMEIITIVLEGTLEHKDSMGHIEAIKAGEVQVMSAGSGIFHSEYNHNKDIDVKLFQIWILTAVPNVQPRYDQAAFNATDRTDRLQLLVSPMGSDDAGLKIHQNAWIHRTLLTNGNTITYTLHGSGQGLYIMVASGSISVNGTALGHRDALGIWDTTTVEIKADSLADVVLIEVPMR